MEPLMIIYLLLRQCDQLPCSVSLKTRGTPLLIDAADQTSEHGFTDVVNQLCIQLNKRKLSFVNIGLLRRPTSRLTFTIVSTQGTEDAEERSKMSPVNKHLQ